MIDRDDHELGERVARAYRESGPGDPEAKLRLLGRLRAEAAPRRRPAILNWLLEPMQVQVRPAAALAVAAIVVGLGVIAAIGLRERSGARHLSPGEGRPIAASQGEAEESAGSPPVIRFVVVAPQASRVSLVGDFNGWDPEAAPMHRLVSGGGTGDTWAIAVPVPRGRHVYAFVVDGKEWKADPHAPLAPEDGFGVRNSVIVVGSAGST